MNLIEYVLFFLCCLLIFLFDGRKMLFVVVVFEVFVIGIVFWVIVWIWVFVLLIVFLRLVRDWVVILFWYWLLVGNLKFLNKEMFLIC